jgi:hypothetical protein
MNLRGYIAISLLFFSTNYTIFAQEATTNFEDAYMKCYEVAFKDKGEAIRGFLQIAEQFLIRQNALKDVNSKSYRHFLNNSRSYIDIPYETFGFINFMVAQLQSKNFSMDNFKACSNQLKASEGYESSKLFQVEETLLEIKTIKDVQDITEKVAKMLTEKELMHPYYRLRIINFLESHGKRATKVVSKNPSLSAADLKNALKIHIKEQDEILVNTKAVSFGELLTITKKYLQKNTVTAIILIKVSEKIAPQFSQAIQNEIIKIIHTLRNELAVKKYQNPFEELTETQQKEIIKIYPENIIQQ